MFITKLYDTNGYTCLPTNHEPLSVVYNFEKKNKKQKTNDNADFKPPFIYLFFFNISLVKIIQKDENCLIMRLFSKKKIYTIRARLRLISLSVVFIINGFEFFLMVALIVILGISKTKMCFFSTIQQFSISIRQFTCE